jgi:hypothetical protein
MTSYGSSTVATATSKQSRARLHKRGSSTSSSPALGPPSTLRGSIDAFTTPFATYEEPSSAHSAASTPKLKPYLRKTSSSKDDQGKLDLSRSTTENEGLAGLGIQDIGARTASDVSFSNPKRRTTSHSRTVSGCSSVSNGSGSFKPTHPFIHPMRQTPRPYTPPIPTHSSTSSLNDDEADESSDVVDDEFKLGNGYRSRRSMSISSTPQIAPTPLSQSHTALDLGMVPKLTSNVSQSNLSTLSTKSGSSPPKQSRSRGESTISEDQAISPSARTSIDKAFSFVSRKSDLELTSRDERIREARRKFEEKEAEKNRKAEKEAYKKQESDRSKSYRHEERQSRRSEASDRNGSRRPSIVSTTLQMSKNRKDERKRDSINEKFDSRAYENYAESNEASLPVRGRKAGASEKTPATVQQYRPKPAKGSWVKFETWVRTRVSSCGGSERRK